MSGSVSNIQRLVPGLIEQAGGKQLAVGGNEVANEPKFADMVSDLVESVNQAQQQSAQAQEAFIAGEPIELHEVMIKAEEAGISMDLLLAIRNKLVSAFNQIMQMPM